VTIVWTLIGFVVGFVVGRIWASRPKKPAPLPCTATLQSGETCVYELNHSGHHRTYVRLGDSYVLGTQAFCWEDPTAGLAKTGFFFR